MTTRRRIVDRADFEAEFFPGSTRIAPGFWVDAQGALHVSIPELLALFDLPDTPTNRERVAQMAEAVLRQQCPTAEVIRIEPGEDPRE